MKAIIYCRKSTDRSDRQQLSISSQVVEAKKIAEREGLEIVEVFKETKSAKEPGRPLFNEMMAMISSGKADCIVTWKLNRLARNSVDEGTIKWSIQNGIIKAIYTEGEVFKTGDNVLIMGMHFGMSTQYILDLQRDIKRGMRKKIENGGVCQKAPLGYINNRLEKSVEVDPIKSKWVKEIFELRKQKLSYGAISERLFNKGITKDNGKPFAKTTLEDIVKNKFYLGYVKFKGTYYKAKYKTFISQKLYDETNSIYQGMYEHKNKGILYPLKGFIKDIKGIVLNGYVKKGITYYKSQTKSPLNININENKLFEKLGEILKPLQMEEKFKKFNTKAVLKLIEDNKPEEKEKLSYFDNKIKKLEEKKKNLLDLILEGEIDKDIYLERFNEIVFEIGKLEGEKNKILNRKDETKVASGVELASSLYNTYKAGNNEAKAGQLKKLMVELFIDTKKELTYKENSYLEFIKFLNFQNGGTERN